MDDKLRDVYTGKVVNKAHTINTGVDEFPRYVVEYLIDNYCTEETFMRIWNWSSAGERELCSWCRSGEDPSLYSGKPSAFSYC